MAKRGRPTVEPTEQEREKVKGLVALKTPVSDIAKLLGRSIPTLRKYFPKEIFSEKKSKAAPDVKVTPAMRAKVVRYIGCNMSPEQVARALDVTEDQLKVLFPEELLSGKAKARANVLDHLHDQMKEGVAAATNRLEAITAVPEGSAGVAPAGAGGKKAQAGAVAAAHAAGGGRFAPPPAPRMVVDNTRK